MKTKYYLSLLIVTSLLNISCKNDEETAETTTSAPKEIIMPRVQPLPGEATPNVTSVPNQTVPATPQPMPQPGVAAKGMNPAHGQPGHRCDISVGAPLNSPVKSPAVASAPPKAINTSVKTYPPAQTGATPAILDPNVIQTAPGMNPPHGQVGHRCDVAVGAALPKS